MDKTDKKLINCPVCDKQFMESDIEAHVNRCLFLNSTETNKNLPKKRSVSPVLSSSYKDARNNEYISPSKKAKKNNFEGFFSQKMPNDPNHNSAQSSQELKAENISTDFALKSSMLTDFAPKKSRPSMESTLNKDSLFSKEFKKHSSSTDELYQKSTSSKESLMNKSPTTCKISTHEPAINSKKPTVNSLKDPLSFSTPLAKMVQPKSINDFCGQAHVLGENAALRSLLKNGDIPNMVLWGPPGCGKTSLAGIIEQMCKEQPKRLKFVSLCAATAGVKDVQIIVTSAKNEKKYGRSTVLFMDEIHRFNKRQQDTFLLCVEKGEITLIGATTENPSFSLNSALLSRCRVIVLEKLNVEDLMNILKNALKHLNVPVVDVDHPESYLTDFRVAVETSALSWLAETSDGDARIALGNLQLILQHNTDNKKILTENDIKEGVKKSHLLYDRKGEEHYNLISAMHKSIRGSDDNAALYWTTRMIVSGEDPLYIARRMVRAASEDIGNADPTALQLAISTMQGVQLLGMPEADVLLSQCAIYLARAPKSREADTALARAKQTIMETRGVQPSVPMHIRNAPTKLMKDLGYGQLPEGDEPSFMPAGFENTSFFD